MTPSNPFSALKTPAPRVDARLSPMLDPDKDDALQDFTASPQQAPPVFGGLGAKVDDHGHIRLTWTVAARQGENPPRAPVFAVFRQGPGDPGPRVVGVTGDCSYTDEESGIPGAIMVYSIQQRLGSRMIPVTQSVLVQRPHESGSARIGTRADSPARRRAA
jgi:hypothetical protein